ncbi:Glycosyltransferase involved in cell wall bisynthesis [Desulfonatronum thiosulfatophilum]|uniref:Glycosyltransferase involved in cell wall bisynthesis n=1 Tax=Desulfonatronum thiosulfatophilum TaxID=617002 RepID=A0A1G6AJZ2_9BACT|nr:glycosyltransferase family 4 protein [Desulfonatronum thiosulfatophilum]SDB08741.1 Glycosyltransferase involved in cell wall bisynthesis [Desulfonatronum thiosulfatophilum]
MRILFNTPFKPLDHERLSGDVTIARDLYDYLIRRGHEVKPCPHVPALWIYWKPWLWPALALIRRKALVLARDFQAGMVLTYHTYYKAPDLIGPCLREQGTPYCIFSGAYAIKRSAKLKTWPGYHLNRRALLAADHIFSNKSSDHHALRRLLPDGSHTYLRQGLPVERFVFDPRARRAYRRDWLGQEIGGEERPVLVTAAVLRPGVKVEGVAWVIRCVAELRKGGLSPFLVVAGDGPGRKELEALANEMLPGQVRFLGLVERDRLKDVFSAGDVFVFPGINEGLGMVYLEAQACGLPVVATSHAGAVDVVRHERTGFLVSPFDMTAFASACARLCTDHALRREMGQNAARFVREQHDIDVNYAMMDSVLQRIVERSGRFPFSESLHQESR